MTFIPLPTDSVSGAVQSISWDHARIHSGKAFLKNGKHSVLNGATAYHLLSNPAANYPHLRIIGITSSAGPMDIFLYEGTTTSNDGTATDEINLNRNSATTSNLVGFDGPTVTVDGTQLSYLLVTGTKHDVGLSEDGLEMEWILKPSTKYSIKIVNNSGATATYALKLFWYEV